MSFSEEQWMVEVVSTTYADIIEDFSNSVIFTTK